jgi:hypothetical protein
MTKDYTVIPLFSAPIFNTDIEPIPQEIKDYLFNTSFERMFIGNGSYSENKYILNQPEISWLKKQVNESLDIYVREVLKVREGIDFELTNSWIVKHDKGDWVNHTYTPIV